MHQTTFSCALFKIAPSYSYKTRTSASSLACNFFWYCLSHRVSASVCQPPSILYSIKYQLLIIGAFLPSSIGQWRAQVNFSREGGRFITRPNCALYRSTILCLYVPGFQRQVLKYVPKCSGFHKQNFSGFRIHIPVT